MWKKLLMISIALIGVFSVGYTYYINDLYANTGFIPLKTNDKIVLGEYSSNEITWDVLSDNGIIASSTSLQEIPACSDTTEWFNAPYQTGYIQYVISCNIRATSETKDNSPVYDSILGINQNLNSLEDNILLSLNSSYFDTGTKVISPSISDIKNGGNFGFTDSIGNSVALQTPFWIFDYVRMDGTSNRWLTTVIMGSQAVNIYYDNNNGAVASNKVPANIGYRDGGQQNEPKGTANPTYTWFTSGLRPFAKLDISKVTIALDKSFLPNQTYAVEDLNTKANDEKTDKSYTLRIKDDSYCANLNSIKNQEGQPLSNNSIAKGNIGKLYADADVHTNNYVSVLLFNETGNKLMYYRMLEKAKGLDDYDFDTSKIEAGTYQMRIINEEYHQDNARPVVSSGLSSSIQLKIVEPLSNLTFAQESNLIYNDNVNAGDRVGTIASKNGVGTPTYKIVEDPSYPGEADQLEVGSDGKSVVVKGNVLDAKTYHFKIQAQDENGDPTTPLEITASITVNKASLSVAFNDTNQTTKSISDASTSWNETATATPNTGVKVTYAKKSGSVGLIDVDPDSGAITYKGSGFGKVVIEATADDDPSTGLDNYTSASTTKEIVIYREVDGAVTPDSASSDINIPTFQTSDANIKPNGTIGTITGTSGTPDDGTQTGTTTTYKYGIKNINDYNFFNVNPSSGVITTTADLSTTTGNYHITVTVSDNWSTKEIPVTINVGLAAAEELKFYENSTSNTVINTKTVKSTDTNVNVFATVKGSSNTNPVTYSILDGSTNVIEVNSNSGAITIHGVGTVTIVAEKQGISGQADARTELTFTVTAGEQNFIYTDSTLSNELPKSGNNYNTYTETYAPNKTFQLYTTGNPAGSSVTYQLKAGSPTDVINVDPSGLVTILNASLNNQKGNVIVQATSHDPSGNYSDKTIELPIDIDKGTRTIAFERDPITVVNGTGSITPNILADGTLDTSGTAVIEIDPSEDNGIAWTNDGATIQYNWNDAGGKDIQLHVTKSADRNYKAAEADGTLHILGADENVLTLSTPGKITYGDHFTIRCTQDDSMSSNVQYTFTTDNQVFISAPQVSGNKAEFDALGNSGNTEVTIQVTRTADGELPLSKTVKIKVLPKPITIQIDDKTKKRLEDNPPLTFQDITPQLVSWNGVKDDVDTSVIQLSTTAGKYSPIGSYPITSKNYTTLNDNYPNYIFTLKDGLLNVTDNGNKDFWDIDDDGCPDLNIQIKDEDGNVITINGDANEDGIPDYNIDSNGDGKPDLNIDTDNDGKPDLNLVMLKEWKPSKCVTLDDIQFSSGITAKAEINVDLNNDGIPDINIDNKGDFKPHINISKDGKTASVNIVPINTWKPDQNYTYQKFNFDTMDITPLLNIDTDGDGYPDLNLDLDGDGNADINIDIDGDNIPDTNIDSIGDGKADINIDHDGDGIPDENIKDITEWKPEHNASEPFPYDTMRFDETSKSDDGEDPMDHPDTDVKGSYYPGANIGGALTGDSTNLPLYMGTCFLSLSILLFIKQRKKN